jgi:hypothetical protein
MYLYLLMLFDRSVPACDGRISEKDSGPGWLGWRYSAAIHDEWRDS